VNRPVDKHEVGKLGSESLGRCWAAMRGAVVDDPENPTRVTVGPLSHGLCDQRIERRDTVLAFTATKDSEAMDIEGGEVSPDSEPLVFVLDFHGQTGWVGKDGCFLARVWMLVFSSAQITNSSARSLRPFQSW